MSNVLLKTVASLSFLLPNRPVRRFQILFAGGLSAAGPAHQGDFRIVNGLPSSLWEDPGKHAH